MACGALPILLLHADLLLVVNVHVRPVWELEVVAGGESVVGAPGRVERDEGRQRLETGGGEGVGGAEEVGGELAHEHVRAREEQDVEHRVDSVDVGGGQVAAVRLAMLENL
eukprot:2456950-Pleurochrysis_carterae.AAC.1